MRPLLSRLCSSLVRAGFDPQSRSWQADALPLGHSGAWGWGVNNRVYVRLAFRFPSLPVHAFHSLCLSRAFAKCYLIFFPPIQTPFTELANYHTSLTHYRH